MDLPASAISIENTACDKYVICPTPVYSQDAENNNK